MSIGYGGEASGGLDSTTTSDYFVRENGLSENQFGFRNGISIVHAIQAVVNISTNVRNVTGKKRFPDYLLRMLDDYLIFEELEVEWKTSIWYLGVQLDRRFSFGEHLNIATAKAIQCGANLGRLMLNIGGPGESKRRLVASVVHSKLLYAAPVWANALQNHAIWRKLFSAQRSVALKIVLAYRTVSTSAVLLRKKLIYTDLQEIAFAKKAIRMDGKHRLVEKCQIRWHGEQTGRWTYRLIRSSPPG